MSYSISPILQNCLLATTLVDETDQITPYKFTSYQDISNYQVPPSCRYSLTRPEGTDLIYYFSKPHVSSYPITILCEGSSSKNNLYSVVHLHRYFLEELMGLNSAVLTVEKWGIDGNQINEAEFFDHYTRSQRLQDHLKVISHLKNNPPEGWNGQFVFIGVSEGGPLVTELSTLCPDTLATINWSGAGDWSWADELWKFFEDLKRKSFLFKLYDWIPRWLPYSSDIPYSRTEFDNLVQEIIQNPNPNQTMGGMTYLYHADAFQKTAIDYSKIKSPFLVVAGVDDSLIQSCDQFVQKALKTNAPITYMRIEGMDHYVRRRPDILEKSFQWLQAQLNLAII